VYVQAHHRHLNDHAAGEVQQRQELDGREERILLLRAGLRPHLLERWRFAQIIRNARNGADLSANRMAFGRVTFNYPLITFN